MEDKVLSDDVVLQLKYQQANRKPYKAYYKEVGLE